MVLFPTHISASPLETVLARLTGVHRAQHGWLCRCPAHNDREPGLSIGLGDEGQILLKCFAGCSLERIVEAMGMTTASLFHIPTATTPSVS